MDSFIKPRHLQPGDKVAVVSSSAGSASAVPYRYAIGKQRLENEFGLEVVEMKHTLKDIQWVRDHPEARAEDLMKAFADASIKGIISAIGGEDSIRMLPYIDFTVIKENPKPLVGYSDTTVSHFICNKVGLTSFYGPSVLASFAENKEIFPYTKEHFNKALFCKDPIGEVAPASAWTAEHLDWFDSKNQERPRELQKPYGRKLLQGEGTASGQLIGGCVQVMTMLNGTSIWPNEDRWKEGIVFLEISQSELTVNMFKYLLRGMGAQGIWDDVNGIIFARPGGGRSLGEMKQFENALPEIIGKEYGRSDMPILAQMDFGHTDPIFTIPYGCNASIECKDKKFSILEPGVF